MPTPPGFVVEPGWGGGPRKLLPVVGAQELFSFSNLPGQATEGGDLLRLSQGELQ